MAALFGPTRKRTTKRLAAPRANSKKSKRGSEREARTKGNGATHPPQVYVKMRPSKIPKSGEVNLPAFF